MDVKDQSSPYTLSDQEQGTKNPTPTRDTVTSRPSSNLRVATTEITKTAGKSAEGNSDSNSFRHNRVSLPEAKNGGGLHKALKEPGVGNRAIVTSNQDKEICITPELSRTEKKKGKNSKDLPMINESENLPEGTERENSNGTDGQSDGDNTSDNEEEETFADEEDEEDKDYKEEDETHSATSSDSESERVVIRSPIPLPEGISPHIPQGISARSSRQYKQHQRRLRNHPTLVHSDYQQLFYLHPSHSYTFGAPGIPETPTNPSVLLGQGSIAAPDIPHEARYPPPPPWTQAPTSSEHFYDAHRPPLILPPSIIRQGTPSFPGAYRGVDLQPYRTTRGYPPPAEPRFLSRQKGSKPLPWNYSDRAYEHNNYDELRHDYEHPAPSNFHGALNPNAVVGGEPPRRQIPVAAAAAAAAGITGTIPSHPPDDLIAIDSPQYRNRRVFSGRVEKQPQAGRTARRRVFSEPEEPRNTEFQYPSHVRHRGRAQVDARTLEELERQGQATILEPERPVGNEFDRQYRFPMQMMQLPHIPPIAPYMYPGIPSIPGVPGGVHGMPPGIPMGYRIPPDVHTLMSPIKADTPVFDSALDSTGEEDQPQTQAELEIIGNLMDMAENWTEQEKRLGRRLVRFERVQEDALVKISFEAIDPDEYQEHMAVISCIYHQETGQYFVTSVDCISLLELIIHQKFSVEEKNRIRRNLEVCKPMTVSKNRPELVPFFQLIMGFNHPRPRNIEKGVKVFLWSNLEGALKKIVSKYSASRDRQS